jgi:hypothetical protein
MSERDNGKRRRQRTLEGEIVLAHYGAQESHAGRRANPPEQIGAHRRRTPNDDARGKIEVDSR